MVYSKFLLLDHYIFLYFNDTIVCSLENKFILFDDDNNAIISDT